MFKKLTMLFATATMLASPLAAKEAKPAKTDADPALWVMKDADTTIYLFGTVHILKPGMTWFDEGVKSAFDQSSEVMTEIVMGDPAQMQSKFMAAAMNPNGPTLSEKLAEADRKAYKAATEKLGIPPAVFEQFERMDPWMATLTLATLPLAQLGFDPNAGVEMVLESAAKSGGKARTELESLDEQIAMLDSLPEKVQIAYLNDTVKEMPKLGSQLDQLVGAWGAGRPDKVAKLMNSSASFSPELNKLLLVDRNARWAEKLQTRMTKPGTVFVAVGAGHLAGKDSVQNMLAARGLKVKRLKY